MESAVDAFCACTSCEIDTEVGGAFLFKLVCLSVSCVDLRIALVEGGSFLNLDIPVGQVLVIPDVVVIVPLNVSRVLLGLLDLPAGRPLHPLVRLEVLEVFEQSVLLIMLNISFLLSLGLSLFSVI